MASAAIYIQTKPYSDGSVGIFIRIIHNRKIHLKQIIKIHPDYVDFKKKEIRKKFHDHSRYNQLLDMELKAAKDYLIDARLAGKELDPATFLKSPKSEMLSDLVKAREAEFRKNKQERSADRHRSCANKLIRIGMDTHVSAITLAWVGELDKALIKAGNKPNTRGKEMAVLSATLDWAHADNPFPQYRKPSARVERPKLRREEIEALSTVELSGIEAIARDAFLFAIYGRGIRVFDVLTMRVENIDHGRLMYKTQKGGKVQDVEINPQMQGIIDKYVTGNTPAESYIFPVITAPYALYTTRKKSYLDRVNSKAGDVNKALQRAAVAAKISKHVTFHIARHTFAFLADEAGLSLGAIQQMLDHGKIGTTERYVQGLRRTDELDEGARKVF